MEKKCFLTVAILIALMVNARPATEKNSHSMFVRAVRENSTSPLFVLIVLRDSSTGVDRRICTAAPFLLGAIHIESNIPYTDMGEKEARRVALDHRDKAWSFTNPKALENVRPRYTSADLAKVRKQMVTLRRPELEAQLRSPDSQLHRIYKEHDRRTHDGSYRDAVAHVLLEQGVLVGLADRTGRLYLP